MDNHPPTIPIRSRSARTANGAPAERPARFTHRLWKGWLWLTGPRPERFAADISGREQLRRARLISALLVLILLSICLLLPSALTVVQIWFPVAFLTVCGALVAVLNRWGRVIWSAVAYVASVDGAIIGFLLIKPKLGAGNLSDFDLFILAVLIGGMILPRQLIPLTGALHVLFIILIFTLKPHDDILIQEIQVNQGGQTYTALAGLLVLQVCGAGIAWLHAWSVERAIVRASRAEELAETQARLSQQTQEVSEQKRRLEQGIHALQEVQARIANGEYSARVSLQENELLPLAVSFNIMAERLGRVERIEQEHRRLEGAVQQLLSAAHALTGGVAPALAHATGTAVDRLFPLLTRLHHLTTTITQSSGFAQDLRTVLQQQHERLSGIESGLVNALALAKALAHESGQLLIQEPRPMSGALRSPTKPGERALVQGHLRALFDEELNLLEQAGQKCAETRELNARCLQGMRILGQRLKEAG